jgi:hypothetical protein
LTDEAPEIPENLSPSEEADARARALQMALDSVAEFGSVDRDGLQEAIFRASLFSQFICNGAVFAFLTGEGEEFEKEEEGEGATVLRPDFPKRPQ